MDDRQPLLKESALPRGGIAGSTTNAAPPGDPPPMGSLPSHPLPPQPTFEGQDSPPPPLPSAPPESMVETVSGYEGITFNPGNYVAPPSYDEALSSSPTGSSDAPPPPPPPQIHVTEREAQDSLLQLVGQRFCWGKKAAENMVILSITSSSAFHYELKTFTEARKSVWIFEPYYGGAVDGPFNGAAPTLWSIPIQPEQMFRNHEKSCEVPHTAFVKQCHDCTGTGMRPCRTCDGRGRAICNICRGSGHQKHLHVDNHPHHHHHDHHHHRHHHSNVHTDITLCHHCAGTGHKQCWICSGRGQVNCNTCHSKGQLRCFIKLTVIWTVHSNDHIIESATLPDELVRDAGGQIAFQESSVRVAPVGHFPNAAVNTASQRLVQQHNTAFSNEKILMQRHKVRIIPISEVQGDYSSKVFTFWVYGTENISYAPDYPQQCCCGCTIL